MGKKKTKRYTENFRKQKFSPTSQIGKISVEVSRVLLKKYNYLVLVILLLMDSCNLTDNNNLETPIAVLTSSNDTVKVGNYIILDGSKSNRGDGDTLIYKWETDENNPAEVPMYSEKIQNIGFIKEGIYKFRLTVNNGNQNSNTEQVEIKVNPRDKIVFEDPSLEIQVRYSLKIPTDELINETLLGLDSLSCYYIITDDIFSLNGIEICKSLVYISLGLQNISDISPLSQLTDLEEINLTQNWKINNINPLQNLKNLEKLDLQGNLVEDISVLENLTELKFLNMMENPIRDLSPIGNLKQLEELWLDSALDGDLKFITELKNLTLLWMTICNVKDIAPLKDLTNLRKIHFGSNQISDLSPLSNLTQLEWLYLDKNQVTDITPLEHLENLSRLYLWNNQIIDILPLVDNDGLGEEDEVGLTGNPLNEKSINEYIPALRARGVYVFW